MLRNRIIFPLSDKNRGAFNIESIVPPIVFAEVPYILVGDYTFVGNVFKISADKYYWMGRSGFGHAAGGWMYKAEYKPSIKTITSRTKVVDPSIIGGDNMAGGTGRVINGSVYFFTTISFQSNKIDFGYYKSTDGLIGDAYSWTSLWSNVTLANVNIYGDIIQIDATTFMLPWYEFTSMTNGDPWRVSVLKTVDNGANWTNQLVSETTVFKANESAMVHLGGNSIMLITRNESAPFNFKQNISNDLGTTWLGWTETNLGNPSSINQARAYVNLNGKLDIIYGDRSTGWVKISRDNDLNIVKADSLRYNSPKDLWFTTNNPASFNPLGYPSALEITAGRYLAFATKENSADVTNPSTGATLHVGDGSIPAYEVTTEVTDTLANYTGLSIAETTFITNVVTRLVECGDWEKIIDVAFHTLTGSNSLIKAKSGGSMINDTGVTFSINGATFTGAGQYLKSGWIPLNDLDLSDSMMGAFVYENNNVGDAVIMGINEVNRALEIREIVGTGYYTGLNQNSGLMAIPTGIKGTVIIGTKEAAIYKLYGDGIEVGSRTSASTELSPVEIYIGNRNRNLNAPDKQFIGTTSASFIGKGKAFVHKSFDAIMKEELTTLGLVGL